MSRFPCIINYITWLKSAIAGFVVQSTVFCVKNRSAIFTVPVEFSNSNNKSYTVVLACDVKFASYIV